MRLLLVAECEHYRIGPEVFAPRHFVREVELWASMFDEVALMTRFPPWSMPNGCDRYSSTNIRFIVGNGAFVPSFRDRYLSLIRSAAALARMLRALKETDALHIRCPSRNGLLALLVRQSIAKPCYIKWAANWDLGARDPTTSFWQRSLVRRTSSSCVATVYQRLPSDPPHVVETFTTSLSRQEIDGCLGIEREEPDRELALLWVGRFSPMKNAMALIDMMEVITRHHPTAKLHLVGVGQGQQAVRAEAVRRDLETRVVFHGTLPWPSLARLYARSRLLLLPSLWGEGCPKVVMEAMLFGTPAVVYGFGALPRIVQGRGIAVQPFGEQCAFVEAVLSLLSDALLWQRLSDEARHWAAQISIEGVVDGYRRLLERAWGVNLPEPHWP